MLDRRDVETLLETMHDLRVKGDADALAALFTEDATFRIAGFGAPVAGREGIRATLRDLIGRFPFEAFRSIKTMVDGDHVAMRSAITIRHPASGRTVETETSDFLTIRDGRIVSYIQYVDTRLAAELSTA